MKNNKKLVPKKVIPFLAVATIVAASYIGLRLYSHRSNPQATGQQGGTGINYAPPTDQEKAEGEQTKLDNTSRADQSPATNPATSVTISSLTQDNVTKDIIVQTKLAGTTWKSCTLTLSQGDTNIVRASDTIFTPDFSTCKGFAIKNNDIPTPGTWFVALTATDTSGTKTSSAVLSINVVK